MSLLCQKEKRQCIDNSNPVQSIDDSTVFPSFTYKKDTGCPVSQDVQI